MDQDFHNPVTETTYRLRINGVRWRITKVYREGDVPVLRHLGGPIGEGVPSDALLDALIKGHKRDGDIVADPLATFAEVVLSDMDRSYVILSSIAKEAANVCAQGRPGFRPNSQHLRKQRDDSLRRAADGCQSMARQWRTSGLTCSQEHSDWLQAALTDIQAQDAVTANARA